MYTSIYTDASPELIIQLANTPEMKRLEDIGMQCGCEYTKLPDYHQTAENYSRYIHSIGVADIVWNFTKDIKQAAAGLFHDISTPVFAHTIDFLNKDYMEQESTESKTRLFIENSWQIMHLLKSNGIRIEEVEDYHRYPVADNDTPMLSADRLEYTLGNGYFVYNMDLSYLKKIYNDLKIVKNEQNCVELCFCTLEAARAFTKLSLKNSRRFVCDEDRFAMQYLADLMRQALDKDIITADDLYSNETQVIAILKSSHEVENLWGKYTNLSEVRTSGKELLDRYCVNISAKKRYINPLVLTGEAPRRISDVDKEIHNEMEAFMSLDFNKFLYAAR